MITPAIDKRLQTLDTLLRDERQKSPLETLCIQRQISDLQGHGQNGLVWNEDEAVRIIEFAKLMRHWKGKQFAGKQFIPEPWQEHCILAPLFGWYREADVGLLRRFNEAYVEVPRKNGKTFKSSVVGNQGLIADGEEGPEVYSAATTKDQANIVFIDAKNCLQGSPSLLKHVKIFRHAINCPGNNGSFQAVASDYNFLQGKGPYRVVIDELHAHKNRDVYDALKTGMGARQNALLFCITTAGYDRSSICWERREFARNVLEKSFEEPTFFCYIACAEVEEDFTDPAVWWKANPNLGISLQRDFIESEARQAKASAAKENEFRRVHLNMWTQQSVRWLPMHLWDACADKYTEADLLGRECYAGLDFASVRDTNSLALVFPMDNQEYRLLCWFWIPSEATSERAERDRRQVMNWAEQGWIRKTHGNDADFDNQIPADLLDILAKFDVRSVAYDPWGPAVPVMQKLVNGGFPLEKMVKYRQNLPQFAGPTKEFERLICSGKFKHDGNPVLRWMASNVTVYRDCNDNLRPDKANSGDKIDGIVAAIMALGEAKFAEKTETWDYQPGGLAL